MGASAMASSPKTSIRASRRAAKPKDPWNYDAAIACSTLQFYNKEDGKAHGKKRQAPLTVTTNVKPRPGRSLAVKHLQGSASTGLQATAPGKLDRVIMTTTARSVAWDPRTSTRPATVPTRKVVGYGPTTRDVPSSDSLGSAGERPPKKRGSSYFSQETLNV
jgi:hypothetical protein